MRSVKQQWILFMTFSNMLLKYQIQIFNGNANHLLRKLKKDLSIISSGLANLKINMTKTNFDWDINLFLDD